MSIVDFSSSAAQPVPYTQVTQTSIDTTFNPYLANGYNPNGYTNWEAAFQKVREANANVQEPEGRSRRLHHGRRPNRAQRLRTIRSPG